MQRDLVERRRWVSKKDYLEGLALAQLAPGPLAAQLAIYLGWVRAGVLGATLVALAFVLPSFLMVLVLSAFYVRFGGLAWMQGAFYGIGAAVIAIIARSAFKLTRMTLSRDTWLWAIFIVNAAVTAWTESEIIWVFVLSGVLTWVVKAALHRPATAHGIALAGAPWLFSDIHGPGSTANSTGRTLSRSTSPRTTGLGTCPRPRSSSEGIGVARSAPADPPGGAAPTSRVTGHG